MVVLHKCAETPKIFYPSPYGDLALKISAKAHLCLLKQSVFEHEMTNVYSMHSCLHSWHLMMDLGDMD